MNKMFRPPTYKHYEHLEEQVPDDKEIEERMQNPFFEIAPPTRREKDSMQNPFFASTPIPQTRRLVVETGPMPLFNM